MTINEQVNKCLPNSRGYIHLSEKTVKRLESEYQQQAMNFLIDSSTTCDIEYIGQDYSSWNKKEKVFKYRVTIKNSRSKFEFDFWDSIKNTNDNVKATYDFYSILACLSLNYCSNFDDFIIEFGYKIETESQYIEAKRTYLEIERQDSELRKLFTEDQLEKLAEIN